MPNQNLTQEFDQNAKRTRRAAAILAACAVLMSGAAAVLTSQATATAVVDESAPATTVQGVEPAPGHPTEADAAVDDR